MSDPPARLKVTKKGKTMIKTNAYTDPHYFVGNDEYYVISFPYPKYNEIDFEVWSKDKEEYLFTLTSCRPDLSTSVLWRYLKDGTTDYVTFFTTDKDNV